MQTHQLKNRLFPFLVLSIAAFSIIATQSSCTNPPEETPVLSRPPQTSLPLPPSRAVSLSELSWVVPQAGSNDTTKRTVGEFAGRVLVLDFYATWCLPCRDSVPFLIDLERRYAKDGLAIIGLNVGGEDDRVQVPAFAKEMGIQYELGLPERRLTDLLLGDDSSIPQTFIFRRDGSVAKRFIGFDETAKAPLEDVIRTELGLKTPGK